MSRDMDISGNVLSADDVRIIVVGSSGAGKSTFARRLSLQLQLTHFELDALHWGPGWTPHDDFPLRVAAAAAGDGWITDGGYSVIRPILWPRLTTVIWLDYSFHIVLWRSLRRALVRAWTREPMWAGNRESWGRLFSRESILLFMLKTYWSKRRAMSALRASGKYPALHWIQLRHPYEAERLLQDYCKIIAKC